MANFNRIHKPMNHIGSNGFDLSKNQIFTSKVGMLLPIYCKQMVPGDTFDINCANIVRTQPLNKPAFMRLKGYLHFYKVPFRVLWHQWDNFYTQRLDQNSSYTNGRSNVPCFDLHKLLNDTNLMGGYGQTSPTYKDMMGYNVAPGIVRMLDMLGYGCYRPYFEANDDQGLEAAAPTVLPNLFNILAYNKIWYDWHRNPYWEHTFDSRYYNADWMVCSSFQDSVLDQNFQTELDYQRFIFNLFAPKYARWKSDLFMGLLPNQQFGSVSSISANSVILKNDAVSDSQSPLGTAINVGVTRDNNNSPYRALLRNSSDNSALVGSSTWTIDNITDVIALRKAEALQAWKESTLRAGNRAIDQYKAHFGVVNNTLNAEHSDYVGGYSFGVGVDEVTNNALSATASLGELGGKGYGVGSEHIRVKSDEFCVLMGILSFVPENQYSSRRIATENTMVEPFDFYTPEFANIGLQPVPSYVLNIADRQYNPYTLGYTARYYSYKTDIDEVHGQFVNALSAADQSELSAYVSPRVDLQNSSYQYMTTSDFYVNPSIMNYIFGVNANGNENTDQLICNFNFDVKAVRKMSVTGLIQF